MASSNRSSKVLVGSIFCPTTRRTGLGPAKAGGMRPGQPGTDWLASRSGKDHTPAIHGIAQVSGAKSADPVRRGGEKRLGKVPAGRDGIELNMVPAEDRRAVYLDAFGPPDTLEAIAVQNADHRVMADRVGI